MAKETELAYIAGFLDGDGCITITKHEFDFLDFDEEKWATDVSGVLPMSAYFSKTTEKGREFKHQISFVNTDIRPLEFIKKQLSRFLDGLPLDEQQIQIRELYGKKYKNNKPIYQLRYGEIAGNIILKKLKPFLKIKKEHAKVVLSNYDVRKAYNQIHVLNRFVSQIKIEDDGVLKETDKAWLAGFFDAEGCVHINKLCYLVVSISNTNGSAIKYVQKHFGGRIYKHAFVNKRWNSIHKWLIQGVKAKEFLLDISRFMVLKKDRAIIAATKSGLEARKYLTVANKRGR